MQQTKIEIHVSQKSAIAAGRTSYGDQVVTLSDADVAALTPEEREEILSCYHETPHGEPAYRETKEITDLDGLAGVREALAIHRRKRLEKAEKEALERESFVTRDLATIARDATNTTYGSSENHWWQHPELDTPALVALRQRITVYVDEQRAERTRVEAAGKAEVRAQIDAMLARIDTATLSDLRPFTVGGNKLYASTTSEEDSKIRGRIARIEAEEKAKEEAENAAILQQYRDYALTRAAGEAAKLAAVQGYDVRKSVLDYIADSLPEADATDYDSPDYEWEERSSPSLAALQLKAQLTAAVELLRGKLPEWITIEVSRVQRITEPAPTDEYDDDGEPAKGGRHTGVVLTISAPKAATRYRFYYSE